MTELLKRLARPLVIALPLAAAAAWRGALTPGVVLFLTVTTIWIAVRIGYEADPLPVTAKRREKRERVLISLVALGALYLPAFKIATPLLDFADYTTPIWLLALGSALAVVGLWLFWRSHADLGRNWSPVLELRDTHSLVTGGVYARIRHPMYAAIFLISGAQLLFLGNAVAGPAGLIAFGLLYLDRIGPEERMMADHFGAAWARYKARTGRILPMAGRRDPDASG
ncbi:MAG: protein-S-isoprenylcysteine O-methyltransferase [Pseudomonadota bacterium]